MQATNKEERRKAFTNFIIFFAVTIGLVLAAGYFSVQVPFKQNEVLRKESENAKKQQEFKDAFQKKLEETLSTLEIVNDEKYASEAESYDSQIGESITQMGAMIAKEEVENKDFYRKVLNSLTASRIAKKELRNLKGKGADADNLRQQNVILTQQVQALNQQLALYQQSQR